MFMIIKFDSKLSAFSLLISFMKPLSLLFLRLYGMDQKVCLNMVKKDQLCGIALEKRNWIQNGCYGNQPQPPEVVFYSIDANTSCFFTKQDLTLK